MTIGAGNDDVIRDARQEAPAAIAVYGASGHTGRFVLAELRRRDLPVIAIGRSAARLAPLDANATRVAAFEDTDALDRALAGATVVINCAGSFLDTARPIIEASLRQGASYLDVTAEQQSARDTFDHYDEAARRAGVKIVPAAGFFGGLADLLARAATRGWRTVDCVRVGVALDGWHPTQGTRSTGQRNQVPRVILSDGALVTFEQPMSPDMWDFPAPFHRQEVATIPLSEIITIARDRRVANVSSVMNLLPLSELRDPQTPEPIATDALGRSSQKFAVDIVVEGDGARHRATATGQDIYAVTAPIVVEAAEHIFRNQTPPSSCGTFALGELFEPQAFLRAVAARYPGFETELIFEGAEK